MSLHHNNNIRKNFFCSETYRKKKKRKPLESLSYRLLLPVSLCEEESILRRMLMSTVTLLMVFILMVNIYLGK